MTTLELFAGTASFSNVAKQLGHAVYTSDYDPVFDTDYTVDIMDFDVRKLPYRPDIIWASPPCETFSVASIGHHWHRDGTPKTVQAGLGQARVLKTLEIIRELEPAYWFIENPRGMLRKMSYMVALPNRVTVTYCQYGDTRMKPTDIWTNCTEWLSKPPCRNGAPCHVAAPRGSRTGTQGIGTYMDRSRIPGALFEEIFNVI